MRPLGYIPAPLNPASVVRYEAVVVPADVDASLEAAGAAANALMVDSAVPAISRAPPRHRLVSPR